MISEFSVLQQICSICIVEAGTFGKIPDTDLFNIKYRSTPNDASAKIAICEA